jgi:hypothetical protein
MTERRGPVAIYGQWTYYEHNHVSCHEVCWAIAGGPWKLVIPPLFNNAQRALAVGFVEPLVLRVKTAKSRAKGHFLFFKYHHGYHGTFFEVFRDFQV